MSKLDKFAYHKSLRAGKALTDAEYRVVSVLWDYTNGDLTEARPGYKQLAKDCGMSLSKVERCMRQLIAKGWVRKDREARSCGRNGGGGLAAWYSLQLPECGAESPVTNDGSLTENHPSNQGESPVISDESPVKSERITRHSCDSPTYPSLTDPSETDPLRTEFVDKGFVSNSPGAGAREAVSGYACCECSHQFEGDPPQRHETTGKPVCGDCPPF